MRLTEKKLKQLIKKEMNKTSLKEGPGEYLPQSGLGKFNLAMLGAMIAVQMLMPPSHRKQMVSAAYKGIQDGSIKPPDNCELRSIEFPIHSDEHRTLRAFSSGKFHGSDREPLGQVIPPDEGQISPAAGTAAFDPCKVYNQVLDGSLSEKYFHKIMVHTGIRYDLPVSEPVRHQPAPGYGEIPQGEIYQEHKKRKVKVIKS